MTKKHFEKIALALALTQPEKHCVDSFMTWMNVRNRLADQFGWEYPRFNREKFLRACEYSYYENHKQPVIFSH